jgi:hypothetical protein
MIFLNYKNIVQNNRKYKFEKYKISQISKYVKNDACDGNNNSLSNFFFLGTFFNLKQN